MNESLLFCVAVCVCYLSSSVPYGLLLGKYAYGVDLRESGSHNFGATNAVRVLGKKFGAVVFLCDFLKAFIPLLALRLIYGASPVLLGACAFTAVAGHVFPVWLKFRGGKGVASYLGIISAAHPALTGIFAVMWIGAFYRSRISALGALTALPGSAVGALAALPLAHGAGVTLAALLCVFKHKENITRLMRGEESRFK
ncbi:MAG: glycerol-3-phosphate 1-O-acyltransferase PlsY [Rickettsiales bacterium]